MSHRGEYVEGIRQGTWSTYNRDGQKYSEGPIDANTKHGVWTWYQKSGKPTMKARYAHGVPEGEWLYFGPNGTEVVKTVIYNQGNLVSSKSSEAAPPQKEAPAK